MSYDKPLVVILSLVYNHAAYIRDCLDGFVMQKTSFPFIAIVHDDASTDGSDSIIREYAERYPDIIKPIYELENQYSKMDGSLARIMGKARDESGAKYVAMCEGDDYWIDPYKLQKQVDFMESHPEYGLVHTDYCVASFSNGFKREINDRIGNVPSGNVYKEILKYNFISTLTVLIRSSLYEIVKKEIYPNKAWDRLLWICLSRHTKFHYMNECMGVYRVLKDSVTHGDIKKVLKTDIIGTDDILSFMHRNNFSEDDVYSFYVPRSRRLMKYSYMASDRSNFRKYWTIIRDYGDVGKGDYLMFCCEYLRIPFFIFSSAYRVLRSVKSLFADQSQ